MTDRKKGTIHIRTGAETERQLRALAEEYGTITTAVTVAVALLYDRHFGDKPPARGGKDGE